MNTETISEKALIARINRQLRHDGEVLKKSRGAAAKQDIGEYYVINFYHNILLEHHVSLRRLADDLKVMCAWEQLAVTA